MNDELRLARECVESTLSAAPYLLPWAFEHTPASSQNVDESYLTKVRAADLVFWLVGSTTTDAVKREIDEAVASNRPLLVFVLPASGRDGLTQELLDSIRARVKYRELEDIADLEAEVGLAVSDEISRKFRGRPGMSRMEKLDELGRASQARCVESWEAAGVDTSLALRLSRDVRVGALSNLTTFVQSHPTSILSGDIGAGKTLAGERLHQEAIVAQFDDASAPIPVYCQAQNLTGALEQMVLSSADGLGDPHHQGASIVVDGIDEPGAGVAADLISQAKVLARTWPETHILLTSRPLSALDGDEAVVCMPQLSPEEALSLVGHVAATGITSGRASQWPESLRDAIQLPLFAVLLGSHLHRSGGRLPTSRGELLSSLVERAIGTVDEDMGPLLRRVAVRSLLRGGGPVPEGEVAGLKGAPQIEDTRLVVRRDRTLVFPLIVFAQWFAAESFAAGDVAPQDLVADPAGLEAWRYPLAIFVGTYGHEAVSELFGPLVRAHAGFASQVIEDGLSQWSTAEDVLPPSALECGRHVREATDAWVTGVGSLRGLLWPLVRSNRLGAIGARVEDHHLTTCWYVGAEERPEVSELPAEMTGAVAVLRSKKSTQWAALHSARPGKQAAWAWRWSFEQVRSVIAYKLKNRALPLLDGPLADAEIWAKICSLRGFSFLYNKPIAIGPVFAALPPDADVVAGARGTLVRTDGLTQALRARLEAGQAVLQPPFPGPDLPIKGVFAGQPWSDRELLRRTQAIFSTAIAGYEQLAGGLFASVAPWMQMAATLPVVIRGRLYPVDRTLHFPGPPTLTWWLKALPKKSESQVQITFGLRDGYQERYNPFRKAAGRTVKLRPGSAHWLEATLHESAPEVFSLWSAQELVYGWLWDDLRRINWVEGLIGPRANRRLTR